MPARKFLMLLAGAVAALVLSMPAPAGAQGFTDQRSAPGDEYGTPGPPITPPGQGGTPPGQGGECPNPKGCGGGKPKGSDDGGEASRGKQAETLPDTQAGRAGTTTATPGSAVAGSETTGATGAPKASKGDDDEGDGAAAAGGSGGGTPELATAQPQDALANGFARSDSNELPLTTSLLLVLLGAGAATFVVLGIRRRRREDSA